MLPINDTNMTNIFEVLGVGKKTQQGEQPRNLLLEVNGDKKHIVLTKSPARQELEVRTLRDIISKLFDRYFGSIDPEKGFFMEIKTGIHNSENNSGNNSGKYLSGERLLSGGNRVQLLDPDNGSPFAETRRIITFFSSLQNNTPITRDRILEAICLNPAEIRQYLFQTPIQENIFKLMLLNIKTGVKKESLAYYLKNGILEPNDLVKLGYNIPAKLYDGYSGGRTNKPSQNFDQTRQREWQKYFKLCNEQAEKGGLTAINSGLSFVNSITFPQHAQSLDLKPGIELREFDPNQYISIQKLPKFIKLAKKLNLAYNIRFMGNNQAVILGLACNFDPEDKNPVSRFKMPEIVTKRQQKEFFALFYAIMPGIAESFSNALAPNFRNFRLLQERFPDLVFGSKKLSEYNFIDMEKNQEEKIINQDLKKFYTALREFIDSHHQQIDPNLVLENSIQKSEAKNQTSQIN